MNISGCVVYNCLFTIESFCDMRESEAIKRIADSVDVDERFETLLTQVKEFEQYISVMGVTVEKRQILLHREDESPQTVYFNY